ncbi:MAG: hypothetical protein GF311_12325 [Candidatus Lokiarchaeota archaeon]|nr:hypothetical protein [Candidatus Lokiarchaeota archaeon]
MSEITVKGRVVGKSMQYTSDKNYVVFPLQITEEVEFSLEEEVIKLNQLEFLLIVCPFLCWVSKEHILRITGIIEQGEGFFYMIPSKVFSNFWKFTFTKKFDDSLP